MKFLRQCGKIPRWGEGNGEPFTIFRSDQNLFKKYKNALRTDEHVVRESPHGTNNVTFCQAQPKIQLSWADLALILKNPAPARPPRASTREAS